MSSELDRVWSRWACARCLGVAVSMSVWMVGGTVGAQGGMGPRLERFEVLNERFPELTARFSVRRTSTGGQSVPVVERVVVNEDGSEVAASFEKVKEERAFAIALDASGSMRPAFDDVKRGIRAFLDGRGPRERFALLSFHDDVELDARLTADVELLRGQLDRVRCSGRYTELYWGVAEAVVALRGAALSGRRIVLVISDGRDEGLSYRLEDVIERARAEGVEIWGVGLVRDDPRPLLNIYRMAAGTGGQLIRVSPGEDLVEGMLALRAMVDQDWRVVWASTLPRDGRGHLVELSVDFASAGTSLESGVIETPPPSVERSRGSEGRPLAWWRPALYGGIVLLLGLCASVPLLMLRDRGAEGDGIAESSMPEGVADRRNGAVHEAVGRSGGRGGDEGSGPISREVDPLPVAPRRRTRVAHSLTGTGSGGSVLASSTGAPFLEVRGGPRRSFRFPLLKEEITIGRDSANDLVLEEPRVSARHVGIAYDGDGWLLEDLSSTNGTVVDGVGISEPVRLAQGVEIRIGGCLLVFHARSAEDEAGSDSHGS